MTFSEEQIEELARKNFEAMDAIYVAKFNDAPLAWESIGEHQDTYCAAARAVAERAVEMAEKARVEA